MKKIIRILLVIVIFLNINVYAAEYDENELIPVDIKTTVTTTHFKFINFYYNRSLDSSQNKDSIIFGKIENISDEEKAVTVSIGLFDKNKKNVGTINYCSTNDSDNKEKLASKEGISYEIAVSKDYLGDGKKLKDIKYISIIGENINCRSGGATDNVGETVDEIGQAKNTTLDDDTELLIKIMLIVGGVLVFIFVYNFMFSTKYTNIDGEDVRQEYSYINKSLERQREYDAKYNPPPPKEVKKEKSDEVVAQEERENAKENTDSSDLHNFYK